jgi:hypothetical protein
MPSRKTLKSVVRSLTESFASLTNHVGDDYVMGHVVYTAWQTGGTNLRVDLLSGQIEPSPLSVPPVQDAIRAYVAWLPRLVKQSNSDVQFVKAAHLEITVNPTVRRHHAEGAFVESPFTCTIQITDDRGKVYSHTVSDWWYPEMTPI